MEKMTLKYQAEGVVLRAKDAGSADRAFTLFTREYGKITVMAYGVRNSKKRQSGALQPFAHLDFFISKSKGADTAEQWALKTSFQKLREDLKMMAYASFLSELVSELWPERDADSRVFDLILKVFYLMSGRNPRIAALAGALKLISFAGFEPDYYICVQCGQDIISGSYFDHLSGGAVCHSCTGEMTARNNLAELTEEMRGCIFLMESVFSDTVPEFAINAKTLTQTENLILNYINIHLDLGRELKSLSFIREVNSLS